MEQPIIMNDAIAFDTHRFVKHYDKSGIHRAAGGGDGRGAGVFVQ